MGKARQTFERRQLGLTLRRLREAAGKSQQVAAERIGKARSQVVELEDGRGTVPPDDLVKLLNLYEVTGDERQTVLDLGVLARARQKRRAYTDLLPGSYQRYADLETNASEISCYEYGLIPGLLQSPGYLRAEITDTDGVWWEPSAAEVQERITYRAERQTRILESVEPKALRFVVAEVALRAAVGSPDVMREQRFHLLNLLERRKNLTVQVLRDDAYGNPARAGAFTVFRFGGTGLPVGVAHVVNGPSTYYDDEPDTAAMLRAFDRLRELALSPESSSKLIREIAEER